MFLFWTVKLVKLIKSPVAVVIIMCCTVKVPCQIKVYNTFSIQHPGGSHSARSALRFWCSQLLFFFLSLPTHQIHIRLRSPGLYRENIDAWVLIINTSSSWWPDLIPAAAHSSISRYCYCLWVFKQHMQPLTVLSVSVTLEKKCQLKHNDLKRYISMSLWELLFTITLQLLYVIANSYDNTDWLLR